jgi:hypothetical protein
MQSGGAASGNRSWAAGTAAARSRVRCHVRLTSANEAAAARQVVQRRSGAPSFAASVPRQRPGRAAEWARCRNDAYRRAVTRPAACRTHLCSFWLARDRTFDPASGPLRPLPSRRAWRVLRPREWPWAGAHWHGAARPQAERGKSLPRSCTMARSQDAARRTVVVAASIFAHRCCPYEPCAARGVCGPAVVSGRTLKMSSECAIVVARPAATPHARAGGQCNRLVRRQPAPARARARRCTKTRSMRARPIRLHEDRHNRPPSAAREEPPAP